VLTPGGDVAGCFTVQHTGLFGYVHVFGEDEGDPPVPGFREGEPMAFQVNGVAATASEIITWTNDWAPRRIDLAVGEALRQPIYLPLVLQDR